MPVQEIYNRFTDIELNGIAKRLKKTIHMQSNSSA
ncbi:unnamed protein product [Spirodela intermedia]|uniref:Uncharacterized protein n=1 Tax=Spirodela intermedia TaxID=51605 RepID=A0A7I8JY09_SPIIN|nr:unnamed protein product [Spirodela intermedia]